MNRILTGTVLATAVGVMFMARPLLAQDSSSSPQPAQVKCLAGNTARAKAPARAHKTDKGGHVEAM